MFKLTDLSKIFSAGLVLISVNSFANCNYNDHIKIQGPSGYHIIGGIQTAYQISASQLDDLNFIIKDLQPQDGKCDLSTYGVATFIVDFSMYDGKACFLKVYDASTSFAPTIISAECSPYTEFTGITRDSDSNYTLHFAWR